MKILLAVDGSKHSNVAVDVVAQQSWPRNSVIRVLSVEQTVPFGLVGLPATYFEGFTKSISSAAQAAVESATETISKSCGDAVQVYGDVLKGSPKHVIVEEADRWDADLIVIGANGHARLERFLGSVSHSVVMHANCSVEVARTRETSGH
jgi:nucleotide-binding universal stress UspA family protein